MEQIFQSCDLCKKDYEFGQGKYYLRKSEKLRMYFCEPCRTGNHDGIVPEVHPKFMEKLKGMGFDIVLNENDWFDLY